MYTLIKSLASRAVVNFGYSATDADLPTFRRQRPPTMTPQELGVVAIHATTPQVTW
jgi:hypothetical protein